MTKADFASAVAPWGYGDLARVNEIIEQAELDERALAEYMQETSTHENEDLSQLDPVALTYLFILRHAAALERRLDLTASLLEDYVQVAGNYLATSLYFNSEDRDWIMERLETIRRRTGDAAIRWMMAEIG